LRARLAIGKVLIARHFDGVDRDALIHAAPRIGDAMADGAISRRSARPCLNPGFVARILGRFKRNRPCRRPRQHIPDKEA